MRGRYAPALLLPIVKDVITASISKRPIGSAFSRSNWHNPRPTYSMKKVLRDDGMTVRLLRIFSTRSCRQDNTGPKGRMSVRRPWSAMRSMGVLHNAMPRVCRPGYVRGILMSCSLAQDHGKVANDGVVVICNFRLLRCGKVVVYKALFCKVGVLKNMIITTSIGATTDKLTHLLQKNQWL